jgi:hypothetical protein
MNGGRACNFNRNRSSWAERGQLALAAPETVRWVFVARSSLMAYMKVFSQVGTIMKSIIAGVALVITEQVLVRRTPSASMPIGSIRKERRSAFRRQRLNPA